jgi:hypothetical protein
MISFSAGRVFDERRFGVEAKAGVSLARGLRPVLLACALLQALCSINATTQTTSAAQPGRRADTDNAARDSQIAARFAPAFHQALGDHARYDYITNFDFDGDWRGDNNWEHAAETRFPLKAYVYYAVSETATHFLIHYAVFHPRDYKGGDERGLLLSKIIREGAKRSGRFDPTGMAGDLALAHENDMEGCLVVVAKSGAAIESAQVVYVETVAHNKFLKYTTDAARSSEAARAFDTVQVDKAHPQLYVEPKGHGIFAYSGGEKQSGHTGHNGLLIYEYAARADAPQDQREGTIGYELLPLATTLWPRARGRANETFGIAREYAPLTISALQSSGQTLRRQAKLGTLGSAFLGNVGASNMARPPWGWFDRNEPKQSLGEWFFDPAATIKRHFNPGDEFSTVYLHAPFLGIFRHERT